MIRALDKRKIIHSEAIRVVAEAQVCMRFIIIGVIGNAFCTACGRKLNVLKARSCVHSVIRVINSCVNVHACADLLLHEEIRLATCSFRIPYNALNSKDRDDRAVFFALFERANRIPRRFNRSC